MLQQATYFLIFIFFFLSKVAVGSDKFQALKKLKQNKIDTSGYFDANNIKMGMRNTGQLIDPLLQFEWPKNSGLYTIFTGGLWIAGKINNDLRIAAVLYDTSAFLPGNIINGIPQSPELSKFKFYKIFSSDTTGTNPDYDNWPVEDGAPLSPDNLPLRKSNQNIWCVYNDSKDLTREFSTLPLSIEVQQYVYGDSTPDAIVNAVFAEFNLINKSLFEINDAYVGIWLDFDIGFFADDLIGIDTTLDLVYAYNYNDEDLYYGDPPPSAGLILLKSPVKDDTSYSFIGFKSQDSIWDDPLNAQEAYNFLKGLDRNGSIIINPSTVQPTKIMFSGDPLTQTGWIDTSSNDKKTLLSFGPTSFKKNETKKFHFALAVANGNSRLNSITQLKESVNQIKNYYNNKLIRKINLSKTNLNFDTVAVNSEKSLYITIKNTGEGIINIDSIVSEHPFFSTNLYSFSIPIEDSVTLTIKFLPHHSGLYQGKLFLFHNAFNKLDTIYLQGEGIIYSPVFDISNSQILFDTVYIDSTKTSNLKIYNKGNTTLKVYSIITTNADCKITPDSLSIPPYDSSAIFVSYTPSYQNPETTFIIFNHNAITTPDTITLIGKKYISKSIEISTGWNLLSLPIKTTKASIRQLYPDALTGGFIYQNDYVTVDSISNNFGFWLKYRKPDNLIISGKAILAETLLVVPGWNLIGAPSYNINREEIIQIPNDNIISRFYKFSGSYIPTNTLEPGYGYWIKVASYGLLVFRP